MKRQQVGVLVAVVLAVGLAGQMAWAQSQGVKVNIPFAFVAGDKELPAGRYEIRTEGADKNFLTVKGSGGGSFVATFETRLADLGGKDAQVVFDKADGKYFLSEVHIPGTDGFALKGAPGKHTHEKVTGM